MTVDVGKETLRRIAGMARFNRWLADLVLPHVGARAVEVGSGTGTFTDVLRQGRSALLCLELDDGHVQALRRRYRGDETVRVVRADAADPGWTHHEREAWDSVVCLNVLEHIPDDVAALRNMRAVIRPEGRLVLYVPALPALYGSLDRNLDHYRRYQRGALLSLLRKIGFRCVLVRYVNLFGIIGWFLNSRILGRTILPAGQLQLYDRLANLFRVVEEAIGPPIGQSLLLVMSKDACAEL